MGVYINVSPKGTEERWHFLSLTAVYNPKPNPKKTKSLPFHKRHLLSQIEFALSFSLSAVFVLCRYVLCSDFTKLKSDHSVFALNLEIIQSSLNQKQLLMLHVCSIFVLIVIKMQWLPLTLNGYRYFLFVCLRSVWPVVEQINKDNRYRNLPWKRQLELAMRNYDWGIPIFKSLINTLNASKTSFFSQYVNK